MKKALMFFTVVIAFIAMSSSISIKEKPCEQLSSMTYTQEKVAFAIYAKQHPEAQIFFTMPKPKKDKGGIVPLSEQIKCIFTYVCQSGYEWHSCTYYTACPLCGNPFRSVTINCFPDVIIFCPPSGQ
jgi:hypothetical protein